MWYWWKTQQHIYITVDPTLPDTNNKVLTLTPVSRDYGLVIEKLGINEAVRADVDPFTPRVYLPILEKFGVAQAAQTAEPGQVGVTYLFGHSTVNAWEIGRYHAPFTLLRKLDLGDRIIVYYAGKRFNYTVYEQKVVAPSDVSILKKQVAEPTLVVQTCDPPGENSKRLLVMARLQP